MPDEPLRRALPLPKNSPNLVLMAELLLHLDGDFVIGVLLPRLSRRFTYDRLRAMVDLGWVEKLTEYQPPQEAATYRVTGSGREELKRIVDAGVTAPKYPRKKKAKKPEPPQPDLPKIPGSLRTMSIRDRVMMLLAGRVRDPQQITAIAVTLLLPRHVIGKVVANAAKAGLVTTDRRTVALTAAGCRYVVLLARANRTGRRAA